MMIENIATSDNDAKSKSTGRLVFGLVTGSAIGVIGGYLFHKKFPSVGNAIAEAASWEDGVRILEPKSIEGIGGHYLGVISGLVGGVTGFVIADKTDSKSR